MSGRRVVFVGPTLPLDDRPAVGVEYRPPARHGDLFRQGLRPGDAVLIIDGVYQHFAPLRHKEILAAIAEGVTVIGTASMGALRAAELAGSGMTAVGHVAGAYLSGTLTSDAEVAVLHSEEDGHRRLSVALVSIRYLAAEMAAAGQVDAATAAELVRIAAQLHYTERSADALRACADRAGVAAMTALLGHLADGRDVKRLDALDAIALLTDDPAASGRERPDEPVRWASSYGTEWALEESQLAPGSLVTRRHALACLQLFSVDYPERHRAYVHRLARHSTGAVSAAEILAAAGLAPGAAGASRFGAPTAATRDWSAAERALVRTFRLPPGRSVYAGIPPEAIAGLGTSDVETWCLRLGGGSGGPQQWRDLLSRIWAAATPHELELNALERGFRNLDEAIRLAQQFSYENVGALAAHETETT